MSYQVLQSKRAFSDLLLDEAGNTREAIVRGRHRSIVILRMLMLTSVLLAACNGLLAGTLTLPNSSYTGSGALRFFDCSDINIDSCFFTNNRAYGGGALYLEDCEDLLISNCQFEANIAVEWEAVYLQNTSLFDISGNLFRDNSASYVGLSGTQSDTLGFEYGNDEDGTPADIGAIPAIQHRYWDYSFENQADVDRWYWVSYPVLNSVTTNALKASEFFKELLHVHKNLLDENIPTYLDEIKWVVGGTPFSIAWHEQDYGWNNLTNTHSVSSPQGYKIKLQSGINPAFPGPVTLRESGFKTADSSQFPIYGGVENWLGYFSDEARLPQDAYAAIWDDITMIKAKSWSLFRLPKPGNYWGMQGKVMPIKSGDMVIVQTNNNHTFQWGTQNPIPPELKVYPTSFVYDEKQDYIPVYISIADSLMTELKEIGLYVNGVCKGAVVIDDSYEQISAYVDSPTELSEGNIEFVCCYEDGKRMESGLRSMQVQKGRLQALYGIAGTAYPYFEIKISQEDVGKIEPPDFALKQNFPNPFNPTTTISYFLPEAAKVRLDIYNVKGQLLKTLVNNDMSAGLHSVVWDAKDLNNTAVASGVYFYRISSPKQTLTKRMLLMK